MLLQKTEKARLELLPGVRTLGLRERSLLLLADGKSLSDLQAMYNGIGALIVDNLMRQGYLCGTPAAPSMAVAEKHLAAPFAPASLAGTRMYLFDICERMFVRRDPDMARTFHRALCMARDRGSMLEVGHALLYEIEQLAGSDRAAAIRQRMECMLPEKIASISH